MTKHLKEKVTQKVLSYGGINARRKCSEKHEQQSYEWYISIDDTHRCAGLTRVTRESDTSLASRPFATALKDYCIPGSSGPHSCPHTLALFNTGLHSLNSKLNPPSGLLGMTDTVNIVESVCQDPGRAALPEQETHSQNIVLRWKIRPGTTVAQDGSIRSLYLRYRYTSDITLISLYGKWGKLPSSFEHS